MARSCLDMIILDEDESKHNHLEKKTHALVKDSTQKHS
jgi:hypothetical protein